MPFEVYGTLSIQGIEGTEEEEDILFELEEKSVFYDELISQDSIGGSGFGELDDDIKRFSFKYPDLTFVFEGSNSEETYFKRYYKNGMSWESIAELVYPEFKEEYLK